MKVTVSLDGSMNNWEEFEISDLLENKEKIWNDFPNAEIVLDTVEYDLFADRFNGFPIAVVPA